MLCFCRCICYGIYHHRIAGIVPNNLLFPQIVTHFRIGAVFSENEPESSTRCPYQISQQGNPKLSSSYRTCVITAEHRYDTEPASVPANAFWSPNESLGIRKEQ